MRVGSVEAAEGRRDDGDVGRCDAPAIVLLLPEPVGAPRLQGVQTGVRLR